MTLAPDWEVFEAEQAYQDTPDYNDGTWEQDELGNWRKKESPNAATPAIWGSSLFDPPGAKPATWQDLEQQMKPAPAPVFELSQDWQQQQVTEQFNATPTTPATFFEDGSYRLQTPDIDSWESPGNITTEFGEQFSTVNGDDIGERTQPQFWAPELGGYQNLVGTSEGMSFNPDMPLDATQVEDMRGSRRPQEWEQQAEGINPLFGGLLPEIVGPSSTTSHGVSAATSFDPFNPTIEEAYESGQGGERPFSTEAERFFALPPEWQRQIIEELQNQPAPPEDNDRGWLGNTLKSVGLYPENPFAEGGDFNYAAPVANATLESLIAQYEKGEMPGQGIQAAANPARRVAGDVGAEIGGQVGQRINPVDPYSGVNYEQALEDAGRFVGEAAVTTNAWDVGLEALPTGLLDDVTRAAVGRALREAGGDAVKVGEVVRRFGADAVADVQKLQTSGGFNMAVGGVGGGDSGASDVMKNIETLQAQEAAATVADPQPASIARDLLGLEIPEPGLRATDNVLNSVKRTIGYGIEADETVTPIMRERQRALGVAENEANRVGAVVQADARVFGADDAGRMVNLPGAPTIQDVAAKLPQYADQLAPEQLAALTRLRDELEPYRAALLEQGVDVHTRGDIIEGGFYLPRGRADIEGLDEPNKYFGGGRGGGRKGFEKGATFESMAQGLDAGYRYAPFAEAVKSYVRDAGARITDQFTANSLLSLTDDGGNILAETAADRINPALRDEVTKLRSQIGTKLQTVTRQTVRGTTQRAAERQVMNLLKRSEDSIAKQLNRLDAMSPTEAAFKRAEAELRILDRQANRVGGTAQDAAETAMRTEGRRAQTIAEIDTLRSQLDGLKAEWDRAKEMANQTPRGQGRVQMTGLQAYSFPDAMAEAINKELRIGSQKGPVEEVVKALNNILRPISATADLSFMGIQGLIGAADKPMAYAQALKTAFKALADENAIGSFIRTFDENAAKRSMPTSADWARNGLRVGGVDTEFTVGKGLGKFTDRAQGLPVVKQTNRAFGGFGDALRLAMADGHAHGRKLVAEGAKDANMQGIANAVNRATGAGKGRFLGDVGDLAIFAPRYFNSQLEMIVKAASPSMGPESHIAREQLIKLMGAGVAFTVGANAALGNEYDYLSPTKNGQFNPNFMRIRIGGQDVSLFAGWDSLLRATAAMAGGDPAYLARTKASPVVSHAWDILAGENFVGDKMPQPHKGSIDKESGLNFLKSFLPFTAQNFGEESPLGTGLNAAGVKSSPLSTSDKQFEKAQSLFDKDFLNLDPEEQAAVNAALVSEGETLTRSQRARPYEDGAKATAFEIFKEQYPLAAEFDSYEDFRDDYIKVRTTEEDLHPAVASREFTKLMNEHEFDEWQKKIRFAIVENDPDIVDYLSNPSQEMLDWAAEVKARNAK